MPGGEGAGGAQWGTIRVDMDAWCLRITTANAHAILLALELATDRVSRPPAARRQRLLKSTVTSIGRPGIDILVSIRELRRLMFVAGPAQLWRYEARRRGFSGKSSPMPSKARLSGLRRSGRRREMPVHFYARQLAAACLCGTELSCALGVGYPQLRCSAENSGIPSTPPAAEMIGRAQHFERRAGNRDRTSRTSRSSWC